MQSGCIQLFLRNCVLGNKSLNIILVDELIYYDKFYSGYELTILEEGKIRLDSWFPYVFCSSIPQTNKQIKIPKIICLCLLLESVAFTNGCNYMIQMLPLCEMRVIYYFRWDWGLSPGDILYFLSTWTGFCAFVLTCKEFVKLEENAGFKRQFLVSGTGSVVRCSLSELNLGLKVCQHFK